MGHVIAVANQKGGVAKTTTVVHIGAALAELERRVLLVDLDPQGHLAEGFGLVSDQLEAEISDVLEGSEEDQRDNHPQRSATTSISRPATSACLTWN